MKGQAKRTIVSEQTRFLIYSDPRENQLPIWRKRVRNIPFHPLERASKNVCDHKIELLMLP